MYYSVCDVNRLSWLILYVGMVAIVTLVITVICWATPVFINCNIGILFLLFFLCGLTMISLAFLATPFFTKAERAGNVVSVVAMTTGLMLATLVDVRRDFSHIEWPESHVPPSCQWLLSLLSPVAFSLAINQVHASFVTALLY